MVDMYQKLLARSMGSSVPVATKKQVNFIMYLAKASELPISELRSMARLPNRDLNIEIQLARLSKRQASELITKLTRKLNQIASTSD